MTHGTEAFVIRLPWIMQASCSLKTGVVGAIPDVFPRIIQTGSARHLGGGQMYGPGCRVRMVTRPTINQGLVNSFLGDAARRKTSRLVSLVVLWFGLCFGFCFGLCVSFF